MGHPSALIPRPRGPLSADLLRSLEAEPGVVIVPTDPIPMDDPLSDEDLQLAMYLCYELHYQGLMGVAAEWEWSPELLAFRSRLEEAFLLGLQGEIAPVDPKVDARAELVALSETPSAPSLSRHMEERGTLNQFRELCVHRSAYQLKEADPHTWAIPRLTAPVKAAMVDIQHDEYGHGQAAAVHASLFARTMRAVGLDDSYGAYLDRIPASTLATVNLMSFLGLHRRWRAALVGHLALFEMTSVEPMARYARALRRLGLGVEATEFYDVHVTADRGHQKIALDEMVPALLAQDPGHAADVVCGARWLTALEERFSRRTMACWSEGVSSLLPPEPAG